MNAQGDPRNGRPSRREFLEMSSGALAGASLAGALGARQGNDGDETLRIALVGCGGRGTGAAAQAMSTAGPTRLVAMADVFPDHLERSLTGLSTNFAAQLDVPEERQFVGFDGYRKAIDAIAPGGVVLLTTPPVFRPLHLEYAVAKGCHVFMEKSFGVDAPGVRRVLAAGKEAARKNLKIAGGLMSRHYPSMQETVRRIREGAIGDVITCWVYREHGSFGIRPRRDGDSELAHQIRNFNNFYWLSGSIILDWMIHNLDVACWAKGAWPISAQGQGGRQVRRENDQLIDHCAVEYTFPDGTRMMAQGRHLEGCFNFWGDVIHGTKGCAELGEGIGKPRIYDGFHRDGARLLWEADDDPRNGYQVEHDRLFRAIREDLPHNETERCARAAMVGILGRMAAHSGKLVTWDQAMSSELELAPGLEEFTLDSAAPAVPDETGRYPLPRPGITKAF